MTRHRHTRDVSMAVGRRLSSHFVWKFQSLTKEEGKKCRKIIHIRTHKKKLQRQRRRVVYAMMMMMREKLNFQRHTIFVVDGWFSAVKIFRATREQPGAERERKSVVEWELLCNIWKCCLHSFTSSQQLDRLTLDFSRNFFCYSFSFVTVRNLVKRVCRCIVCMFLLLFFDSMCTALSQLVSDCTRQHCSLIWCIYWCIHSSSNR